MDPIHQILRLRGIEGQGLHFLHPHYSLRILFEFVQHEGAEAILLQTVGTHDEVY